MVQITRCFLKKWAYMTRKVEFFWLNTGVSIQFWSFWGEGRGKKIDFHTVVFRCCIIRSKPPLSSIHPLKTQHRVKQRLMLYKTQHLEYILVKHIIKCKLPTRPLLRLTRTYFCADSESEKRIDENCSVNFSFLGFF